jgi:hypothetical protein
MGVSTNCFRFTVLDKLHRSFLKVQSSHCPLGGNAPGSWAAGMVERLAHELGTLTSIPSTVITALERLRRGSPIQGQPGLHRETLSQGGKKKDGVLWCRRWYSPEGILVSDAGSQSCAAITIS